LLRFPALQFRLHLRPRLVAIRLKRRAFSASSKTPSSESLTPIMNAVIEMDPREFSVSPVEVEAKAESQTGRWLRYKVDRRAVTMVSLMFGLHVAVFLIAPIWIAAL
jgi:hypothetical protein